jgi:hypothetical protein
MTKEGKTIVTKNRNTMINKKKFDFMRNKIIAITKRIISKTLANIFKG